MVKISEMALFGIKSRCNNVYSLLQVFQTLLLCFMIRNPYNYNCSSLSRLIDCKKDVFYRFMNNLGIDWRKLLYHLNLQLWFKIGIRSEHKPDNTCLIVDDTDYPKTGRRIENIGRVYSHVHNRCILGFKALFLAITDGKSQLILDFAILARKARMGTLACPSRKSHSDSQRNVMKRSLCRNVSENIPVRRPT